MPLPVIPALFKELAEQRRKKDDSVKSKEAVAEAVERSVRTIERWERIENLPFKSEEGDDPGGDLARAVDGYAEVVGASPFDIWDAAIKRAKREQKSYEDFLAKKTAGPRPSRAKRVSKPTGRRRAR